MTVLVMTVENAPPSTARSIWYFTVVPTISASFSCCCKPGIPMRTSTASIWVLLSARVQGVAFVSDTPTVVSFSTAGKPGIGVWVCVPGRNSQETFSKFIVPSEFPSGVPSRNIRVASRPPANSPSPSASSMRQRAIDCAESGCSTGVCCFWLPPFAPVIASILHP